MFEIGQLVKIKENAKSIRPDDGLNFNKQNLMDKYLGGNFIVKEVINRSVPARYRLELTDDAHWVWSEVWLEPVETEEPISDDEFENLLT